jgi:hypothetical protein
MVLIGAMTLPNIRLETKYARLIMNPLGFVIGSSFGICLALFSEMCLDKASNVVVYNA